MCFKVGYDDGAVSEPKVPSADEREDASANSEDVRAASKVASAKKATGEPQQYLQTL